MEGSSSLLYSAFETTLVGSMAAAAAFGIAKLVIVCND